MRRDRIAAAVVARGSRNVPNLTIRRFSFHEPSRVSRLASRRTTTVRASRLLCVFRAVPVPRRSVFPAPNQALRAQRVVATDAAFRGPKRHAARRLAIRARALVHRTLFTKLGILHDARERPTGKRLAAVVLARTADAPAETRDHRDSLFSIVLRFRHVRSFGNARKSFARFAFRFASFDERNEIRLRLRVARGGRRGGERGDVGGGERRVEARVFVTRFNM